jgi:hypothetical protein
MRNGVGLVGLTGSVAPLICGHMTFLIILTSLTIWITINVVVIGLCLAAQLGDLQLAAVYAPLP